MKKIILAGLFFWMLFSAYLPVYAELLQGSLSYSAGDTEKVIQQKMEYNRAYFTLFSIIASATAYGPEGGAEIEYLRRHGWEFTPHRITDGKTTVHFITGKSNTAAGTPLYVISFRGSADKQDWTADFMAGQVVYGGTTLEESEKIAGLLVDSTTERVAAKAAAEAVGTTALPKVHKGFNNYADLTLRTFLNSGASDFLQQFRADKNARLLLTGHSLGGAVATIVGQRLIDFGFDPDRLQVITFGAPAVANRVFKEMYGSRLNLIRVTNREDPVPLALQALLRNYRQFGEELRFRIPRTFNNMNHFLTLYLDSGLQNYYNAFDAAVQQGIIQEWPDKKQEGGTHPTVLMYVEGEYADRVKKVMLLLERFMVDEYKAVFPNYVVIRPPLDPYEAVRTHQADYLLWLKFHADTNQYNNNWFLTVEQMLSDKDGRVLASGSAAKRTSPLAGNILAAMEVLNVQEAELRRQLPWLAGAAQ